MRANLVVDLAECRRHLVGERPGDNHDVGLREGSRKVSSEAMNGKDRVNAPDGDWHGRRHRDGPGRSERQPCASSQQRSKPSRKSEPAREPEQANERESGNMGTTRVSANVVNGSAR